MIKIKKRNVSKKIKWVTALSAGGSTDKGRTPSVRGVIQTNRVDRLELGHLQRSDPNELRFSSVWVTKQTSVQSGPTFPGH